VTDPRVLGSDRGVLAPPSLPRTKDGPERTVDVAVTVNGRRREATVEARTTLAELLRTVFALTGTHLGCEHGVCGACTVVIDGESARSCLLFAWQIDGRDIVTVEGLAGEAPMSPLQQACQESHAFQCGFCTPGMLVAATELLATNPEPTDGEVREALSGNLCRCTGYDSIVAGVLLAAQRMAVH
jgi:carbon-monoxide dehydrogenase small subunit